MWKKYFIGVLLICTVTVSFATRKDEVTLIMVPREDAMLRIGGELSTRYPTLLMNYKMTGNGAVTLRGWSGKEWVSVSVKDFKTGSFFRKGPDSSLLIEHEGQPIPDVLIPPEAWCSAVYKITTTEVRPVLHLAGQYFNFEHKEWEFFAERYNFSPEAINPEALNVAWYQKRLNDHLKKGAPAADDLQYWQALRHPQPIEPVEISEDPVGNPESEGKMLEESDANPLFDAPPEAVVLGAGDASDAVIDDASESEAK